MNKQPLIVDDLQPPSTFLLAKSEVNGVSLPLIVTSRRYCW